MLSDQAERVLLYSPDALFELAADVEQYPKFLPGWREVRVYRRAADVCYAEQVLGAGPVRIRFRSRAVMAPPERIDVTSDDRQFRAFRLSWCFMPVPAAPAVGCRMRLDIELELASRFLQRMVEGLLPSAAGDILSAFERRADQLHGPARLAP